MNDYQIFKPENAKAGSVTEAAGTSIPLEPSSPLDRAGLGGDAAGTPLVRVSTSKLAILEHVKTRPMTVSELSRALNVHKSAVHRHVTELSESGILLRRDSDRKWVYYTLGPRGRRILMIGGNRFLAIVVAAGLLLAGLAWTTAVVPPSDGPVPTVPPPGAEDAGASEGALWSPALDEAPAEEGGPDAAKVTAFAAGAALLALMLAFHVRLRVQRRRLAAPSDEPAEGAPEPPSA